MSDYPMMPPPVYQHQVVGVWCFLELHRRIHGNNFGKVPAPLKEDAFVQRGYCIDAPNEMPGGGCYYDEFAPPDEDGERNWLVQQFIVHRETP